MVYDINPVTSRHAADCGPASLAAFLKYYGYDKTLEEMREACHVGLHGCSGRDIMEAARSVGMDTITAYSCSADDVIEADRPCICFWSYNHWLVYSGVDSDGRVVVVNPCRGRYHVDQSLFKALFTEVAIYRERIEE